MGAKSKPKKKGPKGKRARAKAKLEQVWGETVDEEARNASRLRIGKSRLAPSDKGVRDDVTSVNNGKEANVRVHRREKQSDSGSEESDDEDNNGNSFSQFLKRIQRPVSSRMQMDFDESSGSEESESEHDLSASESDHESLDDKPVIITDASLNQDPFEAHFSKPPLPTLSDNEKTNKSKLAMVPLAQNIRKVPTSMLNTSVDVHLSGPILDQWDSLEKTINASNQTNKDKNHSRRIWEQFAQGPYQHAREVLTRNWREVNKSHLSGKVKKSEDRVFSSMQVALYPAISRYADVLVTNETRQVSVHVVLSTSMPTVFIICALNSFSIHCITIRIVMKSTTF